MKRVLFVYHSSEVGGGSFCLLNLLQSIDREAFEPAVVLPNNGPLCDEIAKLGISVTQFRSISIYPYNRSIWKKGTIRQIIRVLMCRKAFSRLIQTMSPDIVYFNTMMLFPYLKTVHDLGIKTVLHVREHWPLNEHRIQLGWARKYVNQYCDKLIAINNYSASIFPEKKATIVYDWTDMESRKGGLSLEDLIGEEKNNLRVYLFTGGAQPVKGSYEVVSTFKEHIQGFDRRLLVLGLEPNMRWTGTKGKIKHVLSQIGFKTYKEKVINICRSDNRIVCAPAFYNLTDLMVQVDAFISYFTIPHANLALAESIIVGLPSLAARTPEAEEYSEGSRLVDLFELGNLKEFANCWKRMDGMSLKGVKDVESSERVREKFDPRRNALVFNSVLLDL